MFSQFGSTSSQAFTPLQIGADVLAGWYVARANASALATAPQTVAAPRDVVDVTAPWDPGAKPSPADELARRALASGVFLDTVDYDGYSDSEASQDEKQLFALHQAFKRLAAIAGEAADKTTTDFRRDFLDRRFQEGMAQVTEFLSTATFQGVSVVANEPQLYAEGVTAIPRASEIYRTGVLHDGAYDAEVDAFLGSRAFTITVRKSGVDTPVAIDLADMGATPRTLDNVADHINTALEGTGMVTRFKRVKIGEPDEDGIIAGTRFGYEIQGVSTEVLSFSAAGSAQGALYLAGVSGRPNEETNTAYAGQITKIEDLSAAVPTVAATARFETVEGEDGFDHDGLKITAARAAADGGFYALATTDGDATDAPGLRGSQDVVLARFDSTGARMWTRVLGAADEAAGATLAVGVDGSVTVAGTLSGAFGDTVAFGGEDAFVTRFDADGVEQWTQRFGGLNDDAAEKVAVAADGTVYVSGRTRSALGGQTYGGGTDAFVRAIDASGATLWTRQFGGADDESATAIAVADDGSLIVGSVENGDGFVRKYSAADGTSPALWEHALGTLDSGFITAVHADATGIYVTGAARSGMTLAGSLVAHAGARDAFVIALDDGASPTVRFETFLGAAEEDVARDIIVAGGAVYVAGYTDGSLPSGGAFEGVRNGFAAKLDATTGTLAWSQQVTGRGGYSEGAALVYDAAADSDLDAFGLPTGTLHYEDDRTIATRTTARAGDSFYVSVDGGAKRKITIDADDTLRALTFKINGVLLLDGEAKVSRADDGDVLRIDPKPGVKIEVFAGPEGMDLLAALGLPPGVAQRPSDDEDAEEVKTFGLSLPASVSLGDRTAAEAALKAMEQAMTNVRAAHRELTRDPALDELLNGAAKAQGPVPAYLTAQIANYQNALARLGGGSAYTGF